MINDPLHVAPMSASRRKKKIKRKQVENDDDTVPREWVGRFHKRWDRPGREKFTFLAQLLAKTSGQIIVSLFTFFFFFSTLQLP